MKIKKYIAIIGLLLTVSLAFSCSENLEEVYENNEVSLVKASLSDFKVDDTSSSLKGENDIEDMQAAIFSKGALSKVYTDLTEVNGNYSLNIGKESGKLYMLANTLQWLDLKQLEGSQLTEEDWLKKVASASSDGGIRHFFTGVLNLDDLPKNQQSATITLKRGVARFDLLLRAENVTVTRVSFKQVMQQGYIFEQSQIASPVQSNKKDYTFDFASPLQQDSLGILYVFEQENPDLKIEIKVLVDGKEKVFEQACPSSLKRNSVYSLVLRRNNETLDVTVDIEAWEDGGESGLQPDLDEKITIDATTSTLPEGAVVNEAGDELTLPSPQSDFTLVVNSKFELEFVPTSHSLITMDLVETDGWKGQTTFKVHKKLLPPGYSTERTVLQFRRKGFEGVYEEDYLKLVLQENPIQIEGELAFDREHYTCDFARYVENEVGRLTLPEGYELVADFENEDPWIKVEKATDTEHTYRVLGGWKPNDPKADGREQTAALVVRKITDKKETERYYVKRRNYGLPVILLNGIWWCKYNAIGNSKEFDEQILCGQDPAVKAQKTVEEYLASCSNEDFLKLWNSAYIGKTGNALKVAWEEDKFTMPDWYQEKVNINLINPKEIAPAGYEMPTFWDWKHLFRPGVIPRDYVPEAFGNNQSYSVHISYAYRENLTLDNQSLPKQMMVSIKSKGDKGTEPLVFYGAGKQENVNGVNHGWMLIAGQWTGGGQQWGWAFNNYGANLGTTSSGANNTRTLRFKKSAVEYIYGAEDEKL